MISVSTAELKAHLGKYLQMVRNGEAVEVTSHRHPVAELRPSRAVRDAAVAAPTRPMSDLRKLTAVKLSRAVDGVGILLDERRRR